ncbi:MAG: DUF58 domain-containing protein [Dehalococcoidia bacterium]|nr:DUF58 domain-containing protein [Dehalococcoidia bacterium]
MPASMRNPEKTLLRLDWAVLRRLDGLLQGDYRTLFHGFGLELAELREYQFNDDVRYIDWNVTARMRMPYVRQYLEDREVTAWFLLDLSPSVDFGTVHTLKRNLLIDFVTVLARLLTRHGNRVGAIFYGGKVERIIPAKGGKPQVLRLINDLANQPQLKYAPPTDLTVLLETALRVIRRRSLVFIVSDFISAPGWDKPLGMLTQRHEVLAIRLYDPREMELPDIGPITMEDAETREQLYIDTHDKKFRDRFVEAARRREYELNITFNRNGVDVLPLSTEDDMAKEITRFAMLRKQRKKSPASFTKSQGHGSTHRQITPGKLSG